MVQKRPGRMAEFNRLCEESHDLNVRISAILETVRLFAIGALGDQSSLDFTTPTEMAVEIQRILDSQREKKPGAVEAINHGLFAVIERIRVLSEDQAKKADRIRVLRDQLVA